MIDGKQYDTFLFFGAPGSGKGTQGQVLGRLPRFFHCACGDVFRSLDTRTPLGQEFLHYSSQGMLVPDELTVRLWKTKIEAQQKVEEIKNLRRSREVTWQEASKLTTRILEKYLSNTNKL